MAYFADLSSCTYSGYTECGPVVAVGWLEPPPDFVRGATEPRVRASLEALFERAWAPIAFFGSHACRFCLESAGITTLSLADRGLGEFARGSTNILVPGERVIYVVPELILHYIDEHGYRPPAPFCDAVLACPPMRSEAYFLALMRAGNEATLRLVADGARFAESADCAADLARAVRRWRRSPVRVWRRLFA